METRSLPYFVFRKVPESLFQYIQKLLEKEFTLLLFIAVCMLMTHNWQSQSVEYT